MNNNNNVYTKKHFKSDNGMLTSIWGPPMWHFLHTMSFNYPVEPTPNQKIQYRQFILSLQNILPCGKCRKNLKKNMKTLPLLKKNMNSRESFSKYIYELHEVVNTMLHKKSGLTYEQVRNRYENFRARCFKDDEKSGGEKGCIDPIYGVKSKCILNIIPQSVVCPSLKVDSKCLAKTLTKTLKKKPFGKL